MTPNVIDKLQTLNSSREEGTKDPWSRNKLQATTFLNAPEHTQLAALDKIHDNTLTNEDQINAWCMKDGILRMIEVACKNLNIKISENLKAQVCF